uniref:Uncharacterized protein n=1 Tax=Aegilops tauschii subsp. strangulata TaxID=200361 RepID=A0A453SK20_AEGTS
MLIPGKTNVRSILVYFQSEMKVIHPCILGNGNLLMICRTKIAITQVNYICTVRTSLDSHMPEE